MAAVIGIALAVAGLALIVVARLTGGGRLGRNRLVGIRTRATLTSDAAWAAAHRAAAPALSWAGATAMGIGVVLATLRPSTGDTVALAIAGGVITLGLVAAGSAKGLRAARAAGD